jgi:hypothetical protein
LKNGSSSRRAKYTFAHHHNEAVVWAIVASGIVFGSLHLGAEEVGGGIGAGGIYVKVFEKVAHLDPIGGWIGRIVKLAMARGKYKGRQ